MLNLLKNEKCDLGRTAKEAMEASSDDRKRDLHGCPVLFGFSAEFLHQDHKRRKCSCTDESIDDQILSGIRDDPADSASALPGGRNIDRLILIADVGMGHNLRSICTQSLKRHDLRLILH